MTKLVLSLLLVATTAYAQPAPRGPRKPPPCDAQSKDPRCVKTIDIKNGLGIDGTLRSLSMMQFLERATEELERAALEKKSFVPKIVSSVEEEAL